jgi:hypothetical protein
MSTNPASSNPAEVSAAIKSSVEYRISFQLDTGNLVETVATHFGELQFCIQGIDKLAASVQPDANRKIEPPPGLRLLVQKKLARFPSKPEKYGTTLQLLDEIGRFIRRYADVPQEWVEIISLYILMTWVYDRFTALPYLRLLGEPGTGKTRILKVAVSISYKGIAVSGNITGAALFRMIDLMQGTLAVDEADFKNSAEWSDITKIVNNGYTEGLPVIRCNRDTFDPECFVVYSPKIISTRNRFEDAATESRCITLETEERTVSPRVPLQLPIEFEQEALALQNKLLQWRFDYFREVKANEDGLRESLSPRTAETGSSLRAIVPNDEWKQKLIRFLRNMDEARNEESEKGAVLRAVKFLVSNGWKSATVAEVTQRANSERGELGLDELTPRKVGGILRSLGHKPKHTKHGNTIPLVPGGESEPVPAFRLLPRGECQVNV